MRQEGFILTVFLGLIVTAASESDDASKLSGYLTRRYQLEYHTYRVKNMALFLAASLGDSRVRLLANVIDGGCVANEKVSIKSVDTIFNEAKTVNLLYILESEPVKVFFTRELKVVIRLSSPGLYRIKFWIQELYRGSREILLGEREIWVD